MLGAGRGDEGGGGSRGEGVEEAVWEGDAGVVTGGHDGFLGRWERCGGGFRIGRRGGRIDGLCVMSLDHGLSTTARRRTPQRRTLGRVPRASKIARGPVAFEIQTTPAPNCQTPNYSVNLLEPTVSPVGGGRLPLRSSQRGEDEDALNHEE